MVGTLSIVRIMTRGVLGFIGAAALVVGSTLTAEAVD
jgi:hypothetical protein